MWKKTVDELKLRYDAISDLSRELEEPVFITTTTGVDDAVFMSIETFEKFVIRIKACEEKDNEEYLIFMRRLLGGNLNLYEDEIVKSWAEDNIKFSEIVECYDIMMKRCEKKSIKYMDAIIQNRRR
ncbi:hypothetical protein [Lacrimispora amygdalina]|uniref:hypothetical protein n=1 Tax=Lacrimispora amygdalina TaxID=253257 RepID=UPI000BE31958|nr:hypothetical protein [Lacrimispora amygdalina]